MKSCATSLLGSIVAPSETVIVGTNLVFCSSVISSLTKIIEKPSSVSSTSLTNSFSLACLESNLNSKISASDSTFIFVPLKSTFTINPLRSPSITSTLISKVMLLSFTVPFKSTLQVPTILSSKVSVP